MREMRRRIPIPKQQLNRLVALSSILSTDLIFDNEDPTYRVTLRSPNPDDDMERKSESSEDWVRERVLQWLLAPQGSNSKLSTVTPIYLES
jgi:hypothetical protein